MSRMRVVPGVGVGVGSGVGVGVGLPHENVGELLLRGLGEPDAKSVEFWSVSVQPLLPRRTAVVLLGAGVGPLPSEQLAVVP